MGQGHGVTRARGKDNRERRSKARVMTSTWGMDTGKGVLGKGQEAGCMGQGQGVRGKGMGKVKGNGQGKAKGQWTRTLVGKGMV